MEKLRCFLCGREFNQGEKAIVTRQYEIDYVGVNILKPLKHETEMILHMYCLTSLIKEMP